MSSAKPHAPNVRANANGAAAQRTSMPLASVLRVSEGLRGVFGSPGYKPPMLPSVALEIHDLSCRSDIDTEKLVVVLEHDPMLAAHVLRVANSPIFRGRDSESSLRSAVLRLGLKNLGEVVFEIALHMRVFRSAEYSGMMEQLRRHSTASGNLCRLIAARVGQDSEHAFLCGLLHDIGIAAILIVLGERRKSEAALEPAVLSEVVWQIHEDVSGMLVRQWKLPDEVAEVVAHHHGRAAVTTAPLLSAVVAVADTLSTKFGFSMDLGAGVCDGNEEEVFVAACAKLNLDVGALSNIEKEARQVLARVDEALKHKTAASAEDAPPHTKETKDGKSLDPHVAAVPSTAKVASSARKPRSTLFGRMRRAVARLFR
jgi:putative nucleotidyltransferase with HDIG domain